MTARFTDHILPAGLLAARPAATAVPAGALYPASDTGIIYQSDGSTWTTWRPASDALPVGGSTGDVLTKLSATDGDAAWAAPAGGPGGGGGTDRPLVDPTGLSWSWVNQGSATIATQGASLLLSHPADGTDAWHMRVKAVPAKPYSVIVHQKVTRMSVNYAAAGVGWLQTSNNYFAGLFQRGGGMVMSAAYSQAPFALTANWKEIGGDRIWEWVKLTDDATSRNIYVSADGYNWVLFHTVATNSIVTPDRIFFGIDPRNPDYGIGQTIDSWEEA